MRIVEKFLKNTDMIKPKHFVLAGVFAIALGASVGLGLASRSHLHATTIRDCKPNSIDNADYAGGCGAADPSELILDVRHNVPGDLQTIYADSRLGGLTSDKYNAFAAEAQPGSVFRDGHVEVHGQTVMTNVTSMGRQTFGSQRTPIVIGGKTYYHSIPSASFASGVQSIPVMVWFDENGVATIAIMNPCGNPIVERTPVVPFAKCKILQSTQPDKVNKPNTYHFTADAEFGPNTTLNRVVYNFSDDNSTVTTTSLTEEVEHTFTKDGTVSVTVFANVPGNHTIQATVSVNCKKSIKFVQPFFTCVNLVPAVIDEQQRSFSFTVMTDMDATTTLKSAGFTLDSKTTTTGVTDKDSKGNIFKNYTFTDAQTHTVKATVFFDTFQGVQSATCEAKATPKQTPMCTVPGKESLPANSPECGFCKPGIPLGDKRCNPPQVLSLANTGPSAGGTAGLFAAASGIGFIGHKLYLRRRQSA